MILMEWWNVLINKHNCGPTWSVSTGIQKFISRMRLKLKLEALLTRRDLSLDAICVKNDLDGVLASNVTINPAVPAITLGVQSAKVSFLNGARWRRDFNLQMMRTGSFLFSVRSTKRQDGRTSTLAGWKRFKCRRPLTSKQPLRSKIRKRKPNLLPPNTSRSLIISTWVTTLLFQRLSLWSISTSKERSKLSRLSLPLLKLHRNQSPSPKKTSKGKPKRLRKKLRSNRRRKQRNLWRK